MRALASAFFACGVSRRGDSEIVRMIEYHSDNVAAMRRPTTFQGTSEQAENARGAVFFIVLAVGFLAMATLVHQWALLALVTICLVAGLKSWYRACI